MSHRPRRPVTRYLRLCVVGIGLSVIVCGCMSQAPPSNAGMADIRTSMEEMARVATGETLREAESAREEAERSDKQKNERLEAARLHFQAGYLYERLRKATLAVEQYEAAAKAGAGTAYESNGRFRAGEVAWLARDDYGAGARKRALGAYNAGTRYAPTKLFGEDENPPQVLLIAPDGGSEGWRSGLAPEEAGEVELAQHNLREACLERLDVLYRGESAYKFMHWAVRMAGHLWPRQRWWLAIVLIALAAKIVTTPLTSAQFRSMKAMQRIQPLMKELQEKHKGDRQAMAQAQMRLFKEHRVNPLGGCLPLLIQMPILIFIYRAVDMYKYQFSGHGFLWVKSLSDPDIWLLILYAVSMYLSMRLTTTPTADPQQQQMQRMMAIMMPFMFFLLFRGLPSAFILYWFVLNVLSTAHQAYILRQPVVTATPTEPPARPKAAKRKRRRRR